MHKQAEMIMHYVYEMLIGAVVVALLYAAANQFSSGELVEKRFHTINIAEFLSSMGATPYHVTIKYPYSLEKYHVALDKKDQKLAVDVDNALPLFATVQEWNGAPLTSVVLKNPKELYLSKTQSVTISDKKVELVRSDTCKGTSLPRRSVVVISDDSSLRQDIMREGFGFAERREEAQASAGTLQIVLKKSLSEDVTIVYRYEDPVAESIACHLRNSLSGKKSFSIPKKALDASIIVEAPAFTGKQITDVLKKVV